MTRFLCEIPDGETYKESVETIKLFVTRANGNANFQWLILPPLAPQKIKEEDQTKYLSLRGSLKEKEATRGARENNPLNQLLSTIGADPDNPPKKTRSSYDPDPDAEWLTKSISLTVQR